GGAPAAGPAGRSEGRARMTDMTAALRGGSTCRPPPSVAVWLTIVSPYTAARTMTTASGARTRLALTLFTSPSLQDRAAAPRPSPAPPGRSRTPPLAAALGMRAAAARAQTAPHRQ